MALSDSKRTSEYDLQSGLGAYNNNTNVFKFVLITESFTAIDANAVNIGIAYYTKVLSAGAYVQDATLTNSSWSRTGAVSKLDFDNISFAANAANPITAKTVAIYNDTSTNKDVYKYIDITADSRTTAADTTTGFNVAINNGGSGTVTTNS